MSSAAIILAAGKGTRMNSDLPKVLHRLGGVPLIWHALRSGSLSGADKMAVVTGHGGEKVAKSAKAFDPDVLIVEQAEQLGTGHAVAQARAMLEDHDGPVFVLYGDTPFISPETLAAMQQCQMDGAAVVVLGFQAAEPGKYGRLIHDDQGDLVEIVEARDASAEQLAVDICNSGVVLADAKVLFDLVEKVGNDNASGEYYLTDIVAIARAQGLKTQSVLCAEAETLGINSRVELRRAEQMLQAAKRAEMDDVGVSMDDPASLVFAYDTIVGRDAHLGANIVFGPDVTIESGAIIHPFSHLEGCHVSQYATVGPFARLRPGSELAEGAKVGNFVETKNAILAEGAKVNHLSYIGDASVGAEANIGAGTITCNYDGVLKHRTSIGARAFIGSNTALVAPVSIGDEAMTGSGSVITANVEDGALALGRAQQVTKPGMARKLKARLEAKKAQQKNDLKDE